jgi:hypothetical protein
LWNLKPCVSHTLPRNMMRFLVMGQ